MRYELIITTHAPSSPWEEQAQGPETTTTTGKSSNVIPPQQCQHFHHNVYRSATTVQRISATMYIVRQSTTTVCSNMQLMTATFLNERHISVATRIEQQRILAPTAYRADAETQ